jgi:hypothetical protein
MDIKSHGQGWQQRLAFQPLKFGNFRVSGGIVYVNSGGTAAQIATWALDGLRDWAGLGVAIDPLQMHPNNVYFANIARLWAKHFYYTGSNFDQEPGNRENNPGGLNPPDQNAAVDSLGRTFDFLYFFSSGASNAPDGGMLQPLESVDGYALPEVYCWIFADKSEAILPVRTQAMVNIPSKFGMNIDWWEADSTGSNKDANFDPQTHTWPYDDQTHHFAGYFQFGVHSGGLGNTVLSTALHRTGDFPKANNPGDYNLGILGNDLGRQYRTMPNFMGSQIISDLRQTAKAVFTATGRINNMPI